MTVGIVTVAYGDTYLRFLPRWLQAITQLDHIPDEVVIVSNRYPDLTYIGAQHMPEPITWITTTTQPTRHAQILANEGIETLGTEWVCKMDVDDVIYPHALNGLEDIQEDVLMFGISINGHTDLYAKPVTGEQILASQDNLLFAGSPFRKTVWEASSGFQDTMYDDWVFWREAARNGFTFTPSGSIDYEYTMGDHNATRYINHEAEKKRVFDYVH